MAKNFGVSHKINQIKSGRKNKLKPIMVLCRGHEGAATVALLHVPLRLRGRVLGFSCTVGVCCW